MGLWVGACSSVSRNWKATDLPPKSQAFFLHLICVARFISLTRCEILEGCLTPLKSQGLAKCLVNVLPNESKICYSKCWTEYWREDSFCTLVKCVSLLKDW